ncbi:molybdate ABC transporter substrate-binding protein [Allofournierella massiliensis]|uniref:molybdate ABC transporter substrate-binding protein n=1 Tax=Allofournierella massiliensis TaxID=1650663 RepID=UPI0023F45818|nr:molybdate ABC transporter substrate-binding protein [Fournierella massiliensis]
MKKAFALAAAFALAFSLAGCGGGASSAASPSSAVSAGSGAASASQAETGGEPVELTVFAAASLTETLNQIAEDCKTVAPNVTLTFNFDSSGTLKTQIQEGAVCDVFLSAGQKQMDQLDKTADASVNTEGLDFVAEGTRVNLLENKVALCVAEGSDAAIASFDDLAKALEGSDILMAMGNSDVPVGQYTQQILAYYELDEEALANAGKITYGSNVKEVTTQITEGSVDCGVVYCTDAFSAGITPVDYATEEMCGQVIYPAAVLNVSQHSEEAQAFLDYLQTDAAMQVFEEVGFSPVI